MNVKILKTFVTIPVLLLAGVVGAAEHHAAQALEHAAVASSMAAWIMRKN